MATQTTTTTAVPPYAPLPSYEPTAGAPYMPTNQDPPYGPPRKTDSYRPGPDNKASYRPATETTYGPAATDTYRPAAADTGYRPDGSASGLSYGGPPPPASSAPSYAPPLQTMPPPLMTNHIPGPSMTPLPLATATKPKLKDTKTATEFALREYMNLQRSRYRKGEVGIEERLRIQASTVLGDLRVLREEVGGMVKSAESHRWRRFIVGGAIATFIPVVRTIFRRPSDEKESSNNTEYAFRRSRSLISRIMDSAYRPGFATLAFFVFAVMYVFQNEVTLRVSRAVAKRLKRLTSKVERGEEEISEADLKLLQGWRWRILLWS